MAEEQFRKTPGRPSPDEGTLSNLESLMDSFSRAIRNGILGEQAATELGQSPLHTYAMQSPLGWDDLIVTEEVREQLVELRNWLRHEQALRQHGGLGRIMRRGIGAMFQGPRGTGKALAATLLGQETGREVYRIDSTSLCGRYIGETEKNLDRLFEQAGERRWILFFDEADALLGKRSEVQDAHDRYANIEVNYLLRKMDEFRGLAILSSNSRSNLDEAIVARIHSLIRFRLPNRDQRRAIWLRLLPEGGQSGQLADGFAEHEVSGENIRNAIQFAAIQALANGRGEISAKDALTGVRREMEKAGRKISIS